MKISDNQLAVLSLFIFTHQSEKGSLETTSTSGFLFSSGLYHLKALITWEVYTDDPAGHTTNYQGSHRDLYRHRLQQIREP